MQGLPGSSGPNGLNIVVNSPTTPFTFTSPFVVVPCTVDKNTIYLNQKGSYYAITVSQFALGDAYIPPTLPNLPGNWDIHNVFAGQRGPNGELTNVFDLSQRPAFLFIQNVGATPIQVNFSDQHPDSLVYFSFGVPPNQTPSKFLLEPLSILIFQVIFTSNNVVRLYNSFLDVLNFNQLVRTLDQGLELHYYQATATFSSSTVGPGSFLNILALVVPSRIILTEIAPFFCENNIIVLNPNLLLHIHGEGLQDNDVLILVIIAAQGTSVSITLFDLVPILNYKGQSVPTLIEEFQVWYFLIKGRTVTAYDQRHGITDFNGLNPTNIGLVPL